MVSKGRILLAPLDWGLGHATRCIPIAHQLERHGFEVFFATNGRALRLLMSEFPNRHFIKLEEYNIRYSKNGNMAVSMLLQSLKIWRTIRAENRQLNSLIDDYQIEGVISDNRYGLYSKKVPCMFITHQLTIQTPVLGSFIKSINFKFIKKFSECWIPDNPQQSLSGRLSDAEACPIKCKHLGGVSRFKAMTKTDELEILAVLSGPEPQRTLFEKILIEQLSSLNKTSLLVLGKTEDSSSYQIGKLNVIGHLQTEALNQAMANASVVICRSGYSTILDLAKLNKKAIFVPTPGQTEQEYLASYFYDNKMAFAMRQHQFDLNIALEKVRHVKPIKSEDYYPNWAELFAPFERK